ncbi:hypothetical protein L208DRAFT_1161455, partial [Tricholoma matsutake]
VWRIGEEMVSQVWEKVCGIGNVDDTHWVGVVIDGLQSVFCYGDSMGGSNVELKSAVDWWIQSHTRQQFTQQKLLIARQLDGYNCAILA